MQRFVTALAVIAAHLNVFNPRLKRFDSNDATSFVYELIKGFELYVSLLPRDPEISRQFGIAFAAAQKNIAPTVAEFFAVNARLKVVASTPLESPEDIAERQMVSARGQLSSQSAATASAAS